MSRTVATKNAQTIPNSDRTDTTTTAVGSAEPPTRASAIRGAAEELTSTIDGAYLTDSTAASVKAYARFGRRAGAFSMDVLAPAVLIASIITIGLVLGRPLWYLIASVVVCAAIAIASIWNRVWVQGRTGTTFGKSIAGIQAVSADDTRPVGWRSALLRELGHIVDTFLLPAGSGWLRPLRHGKRQTIADQLTNTIVLIDEDRPRRENSRSLILATLALVVTSIGALTATIFFSQYVPDQQTADATESVQQVATHGTIALLSYTAETADSQLKDAASLLTGAFLDYYSQFTQQVVVPAAKEKHVTTQANVVGTSIERVGPNSATLLAMVNQTTTTSDTPTPTTSQSAVRVELEKLDGQWLISAFTPVF